MFTKNELYDLSFVITLIRSEIYNPNNVEIIDLMLSLIRDSTYLIEDNDIRKTLSQLPNLNEKWEFIHHENYYVKTTIFKNENIHNELVLKLTELKSLLQYKKFEQAYDLADVLHVFPEIIADNNGKIPNSYYKIFMRRYKKKWNIK